MSLRTPAPSPLLRHILLSLIVWALCVHTRGTAQQIFWLESLYGAPTLSRANADGSGRTSLSLAPGILPQAIAIDAAQGLLYFTSRKFNGARIYRGSTSLSGIDTLAFRASTLRGIALDPSGGMLYTTSTNLVEGSAIRRTDVGGVGEAILFAFPPGGRESPRGIALDRSNKKAYWADFGLGRIRRGDLNGSGYQDLVSGLQGPVGVALDTIGGKLYWTEANGGTIKRSNLDGTSASTIVTEVPGVQYLCLDKRRGMMYWTEVRAHGAGLIRRSTLDGDDVTTILGILASDSVLMPHGLALLDTATATSVAAIDLPVIFGLDQNYPNPFNGMSDIGYRIAESGPVKLQVFDVLGREVAVLVDEMKAPGVYRVTFDASAFSSGVYLYQLRTANHLQTRKLCLLR